MQPIVYKLGQLQVLVVEHDKLVAEHDGIEVVDGIVVDVDIQQHLQQQWMQIKQQTVKENVNNLLDVFF